MKHNEICIKFREESDFHHPAAQKLDPGQFFKSAGRPMMRRAMMGPGAAKGICAIDRQKKHSKIRRPAACGLFFYKLS